jgi:hypothetical protein
MHKEYTKKWLLFLRECQISRPHVEVETMVLMDSKGEDKDNLHFLQALRQAKALASQVVVEFASLIIPSSLKRSMSKYKRKKERSNFMAH